MATRVYAGNDSLRQAFSDYGQVLDAIVMRHRETGRYRGFGFVTFSSKSEAESSIIGMNDQELDGRRLKVTLAVQKHTTQDHSGCGDNDAK